MKPRTIYPFLVHLALWLLLTLSGPCIALAEEVPVANASSTNGDTLTDDEIRTLLRDDIVADKLAVGIVVGIVDEHGTRIISYGKLDNGTDREVDGDSVFEIGSITKVFTVLLLQDMIDRGEMKLDDPVQKYLPASVRMPTYKGKPITLLHLATHTSGLPREVGNILSPRSWRNPGADYTVEQFYDFLDHYRLQREPGTRNPFSCPLSKQRMIVCWLTLQTLAASPVVNTVFIYASTPEPDCVRLARDRSGRRFVLNRRGPESSMIGRSS